MKDPLHALLPYLPFMLAIIILIRRTRRPRIIRPARLWIAPAILLIAVGVYTASAVRHGPPMHSVDWIVILGTATVGVALGALRGHSVRLKRHPDTGTIEATLSAWGLVYILLWMGGRIFLRQSGLIETGTPFGLYTDAALSLALAAILARTVVLTRRCRAVVAQYGQSLEPL
ncbi:MAG: hypothetical protein ACREU6_02845 [Steroidobacteraceae bacterium]